MSQQTEGIALPCKAGISEAESCKIPDQNMKVLILTCNTGGGHNSVARALSDAYEKRGIPCETVDYLSLEPPGVSTLISQGHTGLYRHAPKLFGAGYELYESYANTLGRYQPSEQSLHIPNRRLRRLILEGGFTTVLMPHVFPAAGYTGIRNSLPDGVLSVFIATDYTCSPGVGKTRCDLYVIPHESLREDFMKKGVRGEILSLGIPVSHRFARPRNQQMARQALGLPNDKPLVLIMTGSMGLNQSIEVAQALWEARGDQLMIAILCGNNRALLERCREVFRGCSGILPLGHTDRVPDYMDAADVLITKGGGLTSTEAAVKGVPLVHLGVIPGLEDYNLAFYQGLGLSRGTKKPREAAALALELVDHPEQGKAMMAAQQREISKDAAEAICRETLRRQGIPNGKTWEECI